MRIILLILSFIILLSCGQKAGMNNSLTNNEKQIVYDEATWYLMYFEDENLNVEVIDTLCINERKRAKKDIENGKLTYFHYMGMTTMYRSNNQMKELLSKYDIGMDSTLTTCIAPPPGFEYYCYETEMENEIDKRFGNNFIDSLRTIAERNYVLKHPEKIYNFQDCDTIARYPRASNYKEHFENYSIDYFKNFEYPHDYHFKNEKNFSYTSAEFILHKDGTVTDINVKTTFQNPANEKYRSLFDKRMIEFITNTQWIPAKSAGIVVNSLMPITIHYK